MRDETMETMRQDGRADLRRLPDATHNCEMQLVNRDGAWVQQGVEGGIAHRITLEYSRAPN